MAMSIDQKRLKATKFPPEFDKKVDIKKVNIDLMKKWIANKITTILGDEDDIVVETCYNLVEQNQFPRIKEIQIQLTGFLNKETPAFCKELWDLMLSAQDSPVGVPRELLEAKKLELQQEQLSKAAAEQRLREGKEQNDMIDSFRNEERSSRPDRPERRPERPERGRGGRFRGDDRRGGDRGGGGGGRGRGREDGDPHHLAGSETSTSLEVDEGVAEEVTATDLASPGALQRAVVLLLHHVALDAHHHQIAHIHELHHADELEDRRHLIDHLRRHHAAPAARLLWGRDRHNLDGGETGRGLRAMTAEGYARRPRYPLPLKPKTSRAHHRPGRAHHRVVVEDPQAVHAVHPGSADAGIHHLRTTRMLRRNASSRSV
ncbi:hypothetical protein CC86DRAFT_377922 [Ophiobolus disseminans]|uniref:PWI domain-containing protein n=1 Tax=Ophiobolus disseminans TaxID=1469910 RepID=A0A6A7ACG2_9PLEO|nr:hypothetical protein CC86DRAFT_377922 [Ophiobolus disseminans]